MNDITLPQMPAPLTVNDAVESYVRVSISDWSGGITRTDLTQYIAGFLSRASGMGYPGSLGNPEKVIEGWRLGYLRAHDLIEDLDSRARAEVFLMTEVAE